MTLKWTEKKVSCNYKDNIIIHPHNNRLIFNTLRGKTDPNYSVYIWCDLKNPNKYDLGWNISLDYQPIYIGKGLSFGSVDSWRAFTHDNDLLDITLKGDPNRFVCYIPIIGINSDNSHALEAHWIKRAVEDFNLTLSKNSITKWECGLINKRRERVWESRANEYLNLNYGNNTTEVI